MTELVFIKLATGRIDCGNDETREFVAQKMKTGQAVHGQFTKIRNYRFLQKFMCLIRVGFEIYEDTAPHVMYRGVRVYPDIKQFREDVTIWAGFYETHVRLDGTIRFTAKSISFANMPSEEEFAEVYSRVLQVILDRVLVVPMSAEQLNARVEQVLEFDK